MIPDYERIAGTIVSVCARVEKENTIYIRGREDCAHFCELIALECEKRGAYPLIEVLSDKYRIQRLIEAPLEVISKTPRHLRALIEETDFVIFVGMQPRDPFPFHLLPQERQAAERLYRKGITDIVLAHPEKRWIGIAYPTKEQADLYSIPFKEFHDMVWKAIDIDYEALSNRAEELASSLSGSSVHITNRKGTNITLNIKGRPILKDDGIIDDKDLKRGDKITNLPAGEVYVAPLEEESEGRAVFDFVFEKGNTVGTLALQITRGRAAVMDTSRESLHFSEVLSHCTGDKAIIGELGFGLNPCINKLVGHQLTDEKIIGTVHLALGENRSYGGKNQSDLHWDLVISEPTVHIDGSLIMEHGAYYV